MSFTAEVFAVEDRCAQLVWRGAPEGQIEVELGGAGSTPRSLSAFGDASCGSLVIDELEPDQSYHLLVRSPGARPLRIAFRTLGALDGHELFRFATISDLHLGERHFGLFPRTPTNPAASAQAAIAALRAWGAAELFLKGDAVDRGTAPQWDEFERLLETVDLPYHVMLGNHEIMKRDRIDPRERLHTMGRSSDPVTVLDRPGLRIVLAETVLDGRGHGRVRERDEVVDAVKAVEDPCLVVLHHHLQALPLPTFWPPGISSRHGHAFVRAIARANPNVAITTGHSHRNRRRRVAGVEHIEVGSVKDYPGVWAGYAVHAGGLRQVSYRVGEPACLQITDGTRRVMFGAWRFYAPGALADRSFVIRWRG